MICYHTTDAADQILRGGFRDTTGSYGCTSYTFTGVWLADQPLSVNEGCKGDQVLRIEFAGAVDLDEFELIQDGFDGYREWCVPASLINGHATVTLTIHTKEDER